MCRYLLNLSNLSTGLAQELPHLCGIAAALYNRVQGYGAGRVNRPRPVLFLYYYTLRISRRRLQY